MLRRFIKMSCNTVIVTLSFLFITSMCSAEVDTGLFIGASIGQTFVSNDASVFENYEFNESDLGYRFFAGWRPIRFLSLEAGYRNFGKPETDSDIGLISTETTAFDMFIVPMIPIGPIDLFAKGGVALWETDSSVGSLKENRRGENFIWGGGVAFRIKSFSTRLEWEQVESDYHNKLGMLSLGVSYTF